MSVGGREQRDDILSERVRRPRVMDHEYLLERDSVIWKLAWIICLNPSWSFVDLLSWDWVFVPQCTELPRSGNISIPRHRS